MTVNKERIQDQFCFQWLSTTHHAAGFGLVAITYVQTSFLPDGPCPLQFKEPAHTGTGCEDCPRAETLLKPELEAGSESGRPDGELFCGVTPILWQRPI